MLKLCKKSTALLLTVLMIISVFPAMPVFAETSTVAAWDCTAAPASALVPATSGTKAAEAVLANFKGVTPTYSSNSLSLPGWDSGAGSKYWQMNFSTRGFENLTIAARTRSSGTGPRDFKVVYSIDGGATWNDIPNSTYAITTTTLSYFMPAVALPADAANCQNLQVRFVMTSNISSRAGTSTYSATDPVQSGGTSNINNIMVTGTTVAAEPDTQAPAIAHTPVTMGNNSADLEIKAVVTDNVAVSSVKAFYRTVGQADYNTLDMLPSDGEYAAVIPKDELDVAGLEYYIEASDGVNTATSPADISLPYTVSISAADVIAPEITNPQPASGTSTRANLRPEISAEYSDLSGINEASVKLLVDGIDVTSNAAITASRIIYIPSADLAAGKHNASVEAADVFNNKAVTEWDFNVGEPVYKPYFGQLHSHTTNSDGIGSLSDAFSHAKNDAKLDFFAVTDHSNSLDNAATATITDGSASAKWANGRAAAAYTDPGFAGIYAYEMTWSDGTGHINTFNTPGFENRTKPAFTGLDALKNYFIALKSVPLSISQFNHPGTTFGDFNDFASYDSIIDKNITLIEVGNGEGQVRSSGYFASYEYYTRALDKGWHLAPTNNQDNHLGNWGDSNTARTVLLAESLSVDNMYDAMRNRRGYATEDNNLRISYTLNGNVMGTILDQKPESVDIKVDITDPDNEALGTISVISNGGRVVASEPLSTGTDSAEFVLPSDYSYYYIRIDEADKDIAVTAPVWIGEVDKAGIAKTSSSNPMNIKDRKTTITSSLYNNENAPMNIESLVYSIGGTVINEAASLSAVASLGTSSYGFDYTPDRAGKNNIDVLLTANINGVEKVYSDVLKLDVIDPALVTNVVVDASHFNDYVSGYYANNMTNLITLGNNENINVILQKDKLTADVLKDTQLLILSPPAKKAGTANGVAYPASPYTADEIAAIKEYADNGGNIIITSLADYQDSRTDPTLHSAYQQNLILEAIGAGSRINDDEIVDYDNNPNVPVPGVAGGTPYRIPMNVYNTASPYLYDIVPAQNYSFYSGCSFTTGSNATWLVKGTPTTYGFDSDNDKLGGTYVAAANKTIPADTGVGKGNVNGLAVETLPGGGNLFIGGTVFYSNFEIKVQLDNAAQLQNSNYNITMNILDSIKKIIPVTDIDEIRSGNIGDAFCAEGIATAGTESGNAFFDTIYIQDATGGINIFPVSGMDIKVGQKVKVTGTLDEYQGEKELRAITDCVVITDSSIAPVSPKELSTGDSMLEENAGWLAKVQGKVTGIVGNSLYIDDGTGAARVYVDGYIGDGSGNQDSLGKWDTNIKVGDLAGAIGLASRDTEGGRLRVRNTTEIVRLTKDVTGVELDRDFMTVNAGEAQQLKATVVPGDATCKDLVWTTGNELVAVVENGLVTAIGAGSTDIVVTTVDGSFSKVCKVSVIVPVTGIKLTKENTTIKLGESETLTAVIFPDNSTNKNLAWTSSDPSVATVKDGKVSGLKLGTATITVKSEDGGFTDACKILVVKTPVTGVRIINDKETLKVGKTKKLIARVFPSNATVKNAVWTSSDPTVATVKDGLVKGLRVGTVDITVTTEDGSFKDTCRIFAGANVTGIKIEHDNKQIDVGKSEKINVVISPSNATNKKVLWESSDETVAIVSESGVVTGLKKGSAVITATSEDGGFSDNCVVTVGVGVTCVRLTKEHLTLTVGKAETLKAYVFPRNATDKELEWTSSDISVAVVVNGQVRAVGKGEAVITVKTGDGGFTDVCKVTVEKPGDERHNDRH